MRKGLIFFLGIVTGCVLTIAVLFVIAKNSSDLPGLIIASKNSSSRYGYYDFRATDGIYYRNKI